MSDCWGVMRCVEVGGRLYEDGLYEGRWEKLL